MYFLRSVLALMIGMLLCNVSWARGRGHHDGFRAARTINSTHFEIALGAGVDSFDLIRRLNIGPHHRILAGQNLSDPKVMTELGPLMDVFFIWISGVLDMHLYSYRGSIKVVARQEELNGIYRALYGRSNKGQKGFYIYEVNTLYISAENFTKEILGHEMAHAVTSNFFVVQPPVKVAEVLSGYIEYQLRK